MTSATAKTARDGELAGARAIGRGFGEHLHVEDNEANPLVLTTTTNGARRRPATRRSGAAARVDGGGGAPVVGGERGRATELLHPVAHLLATAASGGDGGEGAATQLEIAGDG